jgi:hypothetical protein
MTARILEPPSLWLQNHTDLRAHEFAHSPTFHIIPCSLTVRRPEARDFVGSLEPYAVGVVYNNFNVRANYRQSRSVCLTIENEQTHTYHTLGRRPGRRYVRKHTFFPFKESWPKCLIVSLCINFGICLLTFHFTYILITYDNKRKRTWRKVSRDSRGIL